MTTEPIHAHVLIVDDDENIRALIAEVLTGAGYKATGCPDGLSALSAFAPGIPPPDLVLLDVFMPGMDGAETLRQILKRQPDARVLLCTGFVESAETRALVAMGARGVIRKPFAGSTLLQQVEQALAARP